MDSRDLQGAGSFLTDHKYDRASTQQVPISCRVSGPGTPGWHGGNLQCSDEPGPLEEASLPRDLLPGRLDTLGPAETRGQGWGDFGSYPGCLIQGDWRYQGLVSREAYF